MSSPHVPHRSCLLAVLLAALLPPAFADPAVHVTRLSESPIITESMLPGSDGGSINGPSLIRVPSWVKDPLGRYYLYFAHHAGSYIRLAYADRVEGPWKIHAGGVQPLDDQHTVTGHIASPEAVIDEATHQIFLFYHGNPGKMKVPGAAGGETGQITSVSVSADGLNFKPLDRVVGPAYLRVFSHGGQWYALNHSGTLRRAAALGEPFEPVATIIGPEIAAAVDPARLGEPGAPPVATRPQKGENRYAIRHVGLDLFDDRLTVFFSCVGHRPERILGTVVDLGGAADTWKAKGVFEVARPATADEGANLPLAYSHGGISRTRVNELRDPTVYREGDKAWLVYAISGEHGLGLARLEHVPSVPARP